MTLYEAVQVRISTRSYDGKPLEAADRAALEAVLAGLSRERGPFGHGLRFVLVEAEPGAFSARMGTYGFISGASAYLVAAVPRGPGAMEDFGYLLEKAVLGATAAGIDTCWIGGLFSRGRAAQAIGVREDEIVPAVIALGHAASRRTLLDALVTASARARTRRPLEALVRVDGAARSGAARSGAARLDELPEPLRAALEAVRIGPSASNKQPWRLALTSPEASDPAETTDSANRSATLSATVSPGAGWQCELRLAEDKIYNSALGEARMQNIDMGIAMAHFEIAAGALGLPGSWSPLPQLPDSLRKPIIPADDSIPIALWS